VVFNSTNLPTNTDEEIHKHQWLNTLKIKYPITQAGNCGFFGLRVGSSCGHVRFRLDVSLKSQATNAQIYLVSYLTTPSVHKSI